MWWCAAAVGSAPAKIEGRGVRTPNLLIWSQKRCRCAIHPLISRCLRPGILGTASHQDRPMCLHCAGRQAQICHVVGWPVTSRASAGPAPAGPPAWCLGKHRSNFGSRYKLGCCGYAGFFCSMGSNPAGAIPTPPYQCNPLPAAARSIARVLPKSEENRVDPTEA